MQKTTPDHPQNRAPLHSPEAILDEIQALDTETAKVLAGIRGML